MEFFYLLCFFYILAILASIGVVLLRNPVHSVLNLVLVFFFGGCMLLILGAEFIAFTLVLIYVGALSVLFLFVVMMLRIKEVEMVSSKAAFLPFGFLFSFGFVSSFLFLFNPVIFVWPGSLVVRKNIHYVDWLSEIESVWNIETLAEVLYRQYAFVFLSLGFILLCAMVGAISLTFDLRGWYISVSRRQDIFMQVAVTSSEVQTLMFVE